MLPIFRRCIELDEQEGWADLFLLVEETASPRVRNVLRRFGVSNMETETVVLELFEALYAEDHRRLRSCRAETDGEFRVWLWQVASHFTLDWVERLRRAAAREERAMSRTREPDRSGPDEAAIQTCLEEWRPCMTHQDFDRLLLLIGSPLANPAVCGRTRRHWTQELINRYHHLFSGVGGEGE